MYTARFMCACNFRGDPKQCCTALIEDWISSNNGVKPKTWDKLIEVLSEINELTSATRDIKDQLQLEGIELNGMFLCMTLFIIRMLVHGSYVAPNHLVPCHLLSVEISYLY